MLNYEQIPEELRWDRQWCLAGPDSTGKNKAPHALGPRGLFHVTPTQDYHWKDFETTLDAAALCPPCGIGFVLTKQDPYTCIDLDIKNANNEPNHPEKWTTKEEIDRFYRIITAFDSYTERSASGQGFHVWIRGSVGQGLKRDGVEIYSQERFIVCTGDVFLAKDIESRQEMLNILASEITGNAAGTKPQIELVEVEEIISDSTIFQRARDADNADKFVTLCEGNFENYPSQSEADLALLSIFAFYTKSNEQCRRLFRLTKLGERAKATKNDVALNRSLVIIRGRQAAEDVVDVYAEASTAALLATLHTKAPPAHALAPPPAPTNAPSQALQAIQATQAYAQIATQYNAPIIPPKRPPILFPEELIALEAKLKGEQIDLETGEISSDFEPERVEENGDEETDPDFKKAPQIDWPPGMVGELARYIFEGAPRPVREVAIVSALGLMSGVCGKAFNIPQSGLNLYIVLVARSAVGKEAMHSGIANVMGYVRDSVPNAMDFIDFSDYASGPALSKAIAGNPSFVNVSGEWGRKLRRLGQEDGRDGPMQQLRTVMTNLYQKSGPASIVGGIGYSDKEKNVASVSGAAYSMIGETTPQTFYDALTENMMEDGFLSRFTVIEYTGERPPANHTPIRKPSAHLLEVLCALMAQAIDLNRRFVTQEVLKNPEASEILAAFDLECDTQINKTDEEGWRQMWNRAHLKAYRIAALLAVGDNHIAPVITKAHAEWALDLIRRDINIMRRRINSGDVGVGDNSRERKILSILQIYLTKPVPASYGVPEKMRSEGVVPRKYIQVCTQRSTAFTGHRAGHTHIMDATIKSLIDSGYLLEISKEKTLANYTFHGRCFRILNLPLNSQENKSLKSGRNK